MHREHKALTASVKADEAEGIITAIVSVFGNIDSYGERVMPGAFTKSLANKLPIGVLAHDWSNPISETLSAEELMPGDERLPADIRDLGGLLIVARFFKDIPDSWITFKKIVRGLFREFSIGYMVVADGFKDGVRELYHVELHEWSPVLVGANNATSLLAVKSPSFDAHVQLLESELTEVVSRAVARTSMRVKEGRVLSSRNAAALTELADALGKARKEILRIVSEATPKPKEEGKGRMLIAQHLLREALNDN